MRYFVLKLTQEQATELREVLMYYEDEGPGGESWQSQELEALAEVVFQQLDSQGHSK
jgi:hypothetical protein